MMTVRFSSGLSIQYNDASYAARHSDGWTDIYTKKDGAWIAQVPTAAAVIEVVPSSRVYHADALNAAESLVATLSSRTERQRVSGRALATLKRMLAAFDARSFTWTDR